MVEKHGRGLLAGGASAPLVCAILARCVGSHRGTPTPRSLKYARRPRHQPQNGTTSGTLNTLITQIFSKRNQFLEVFLVSDERRSETVFLPLASLRGSDGPTEDRSSNAKI